MTPAIRVQNLGKRYRISHEGNTHGKYRTLRDSVTDLAKAPFRRLKNRGEESRQEDFWALKEVSFDVQPGEVVGIIGRNGAGKSTLLKILSRITKPSTGSVELNGRVGSLLEVGTGFHPELTGRENIFLNGSILGMKRAEIQKQFDAIVDFSGVEQFLDTPVKRYSSGMYVRLAFAVSAHLSLEVLIVDEVLSVGDAAFQKKCLGRMGEIAHNGRTVLFVSHNLPMLLNLCERAAWLVQGSLADFGRCEKIVDAYCSTNSSTAMGASISLDKHPGRASGSQQTFSRISLRTENLQPTSSIPIGGTLVVDLHFSHAPSGATAIMIEICDQFGTRIARANSQVESQVELPLTVHDRFRCEIKNMRMMPGVYTMSLGLQRGEDFIDRIENCISFSVETTDLYGTGRLPSSQKGMFALETYWDSCLAS